MRRDCGGVLARVEMLYGVLGVCGRFWSGYGTDPLPSPQEALNESLRAFPSWFPRITFGRCGKEPSRLARWR
jgi:hypothetical protein